MRFEECDSDMASAEHPYLTPRRLESGSGWYVEVQWLQRGPEKIGHFGTFAEACAWMNLEASSYFVLRELGALIKPARQQANQSTS
jgi:hypothetical protein